MRCCINETGAGTACLCCCPGSTQRLTNPTTTPSLNSVWWVDPSTIPPEAAAGLAPYSGEHASGQSYASAGGGGAAPGSRRTPPNQQLAAEFNAPGEFGFRVCSASVPLTRGAAPGSRRTPPNQQLAAEFNARDLVLTAPRLPNADSPTPGPTPHPTGGNFVSLAAQYSVLPTTLLSKLLDAATKNSQPLDWSKLTHEVEQWAGDGNISLAEVVPEVHAWLAANPTVRV